MLWAMPHDFEGSVLTGGYCYVPISQVNSVSVSMRFVTFPQMQTVVCYLTKPTPPCSLQISLPIISHINLSPSLSFTSAHLMLTDFITTPLYLMDSAFLEVASHGVTTQMTYFTTCLFQCITCLFHVPRGTLVLISLSYEACFLSYSFVSPYFI